MQRIVHGVRVMAALGFAVTAVAAAAAEYQSVGNDPAILYDAPTLRGNRVAVAPRGMPVEVVVAQADWVRVRDAAGGLSWIEKKMLASRRTVVAIGTGVDGLDVHAGADDASPVVFRVQSGVLLDLTAPPSSGWVAVRHRDGQVGFVRAGRVWGT